MRSKPDTPMVVLLFALALAGCGDAGDAGSEKNPTKRDVSGPPFVSRQTGKVGLLAVLASRSGGGTASAIARGQTLAGVLEPDDEMSEYGKYLDVWEFSAQGGEAVTIRMESEDFDTFLVLEDEAGTVTMDDDGGEGTNSKIDAILPASGVYRIVATSFAEADVGTYALSLTDAGFGVIDESGPVSGSLGPEDPILGDRGTHYDTWVLSATAGDRVVVEASSDEFDTFVFFGEGVADAIYLLDEDDDGGRGTNSALTSVIPDDGAYTVIVTSYGEGETGGYTLRLVSSTPDWTATYPGGGDPADRYAVVVGVSDYPGEENDLHGGPSRDAAAMTEILIDHYGFSPSNVVTLIDVDGTRDQIANAILRHLGQAGEEGLAVLYYTGHGTQLEYNTGIRPPLDVEPDGVDEGLYVWGYGEGGSVILDDEIGYLFDRLSAGRKLIIVDACNSGTIARGSLEALSVNLRAVEVSPYLPERSFIEALPARTGAAGEETGLVDIFDTARDVIVLSSAAADELALGATSDVDGEFHAVFSVHLAQTLREMDNETTFAQMHETLRDNVLALTRDRFSHVQTAQIEGPGLDQSVRAFLENR